MKSNHKIRLMMFAVLWLFSLTYVHASQEIMFFTPDEAIQLKMTDEEWQTVESTRSLSFGPRISVKIPKPQNTADGVVIETASPAKLSVFFEPTHAPINMESLKVIAKKGFFSKSLTDLLRPYIKMTQLEAENINIPEGKFHIQISIADKDGMETVETYLLKVNK